MENPVMAALNPQVASTTSLDLPPALASILSMPAAPVAAPMAAPTAAPMAAPSPTLGGALGGQSSVAPQPLPSFQEGGMVGPGGQPMPGVQSQAQAVAPMDPTQRDQLLNQSMQQNPQVVQEIQATLMAGLESGEVTPQELNMIIQLTQLAAQNPDMYPYVRQFAIQQGIAAEEDLPQQYDEGLMVAMLTVAKSAQQLIQGGQPMVAGEAPMTGQLEATMPSMKEGGTVKGKSDAPVPIMAHEGEYVIPKNVVQMKGREFFDRLVEQYKEKA
jgi:hypothetical protein